MASDASFSVTKAEDAHDTEAQVKEFGTNGSLSAAHSKFLLDRYGTVDLEPLPDPTPADPLNWPQSKKLINLVLVAFHSCICSFTASSVIPAFKDISERLGVSIQAASYMTSLQIAVLGGAPLIWHPLAKRYGRFSIYTLCLLGSIAANIGSARSTTYGALAACRAIGALFISPAAALGSGTLQEMFFARERAKYMGVWTLMFTVGVPFAPFVFGFAVERVGYEWIFWTLAITNVVQFILYLALGSETRYIRGRGDESSPIPHRLALRRIDPTPFSIFEFVHPFAYAVRWRVAIPAASYAMIFLFCSVMTTVEIPQLFAEKFHFGAQTLGLQFLGLMVGSLVGEALGTTASTHWMARGSAKNGGQPPLPERRLWLSYVGYAWAICGIVVFLLMSEQLKVYNVSPIVGAGIAAAGNQVVTTVLVNYAVDCYPNDAASVGVFITFVRQIWGFIGPFWFPQMFTATGKGSAGVAVAMLVGLRDVLQWTNFFYMHTPTSYPKTMETRRKLRITHGVKIAVYRIAVIGVLIPSLFDVLILAVSGVLMLCVPAELAALVIPILAVFDVLMLAALNALMLIVLDGLLGFWLTASGRTTTTVVCAPGRSIGKFKVYSSHADGSVKVYTTLSREKIY
ncbi:hypothetical protein PWT90_10322 [Aphanocladium album]|nr:hypothetical protein PWT90_10322 [Aphanocladium album]